MSWQLAVWVLCFAALGQLVCQSLWSVRNERFFRAQRAELARLQQAVRDKLAPQQQLLELTREHVTLCDRVLELELVLGVRPKNFSGRGCDEPAPETERARIDS